MVTVVHGDFPDFLEDEFTFTEADLTAFDHVFTIFVVAFDIGLVWMVMDRHSSGDSSGFWSSERLLCRGEISQVLLGHAEHF
jgi:hypothetical protein